MKLSKKTLDILKAFSSINTNLVIKPGSKITTVTPGKTVYAEATVTETFDKGMGIYNLNEFLGVLGLFTDPELEMSDKSVVIKEGKNKVTYVYADPSLLTPLPTKQIKLASVEVEFTLTSAHLSQLLKMAQVLGVEDLAFIGDGKKLIARVFDGKNPTGNQFDIDLETTTSDNFSLEFKISNIKLIPGDYSVEISKSRLSKFDNNDGVVTFVAVEATSTFED